MEKKQRGRPPIKNPASERLPSVRVTPDQLKAYIGAAKSTGKPLAAWVKESLDKCAKHTPKQ